MSICCIWCRDCNQHWSYRLRGMVGSLEAALTAVDRPLAARVGGGCSSAVVRVTAVLPVLCVEASTAASRPFHACVINMRHNVPRLREYGSNTNCHYSMVASKAHKNLIGATYLRRRQRYSLFQRSCSCHCIFQGAPQPSDLHQKSVTKHWDRVLCKGQRTCVKHHF